jgi:aminoglycoside 6'-N-acetyltransferase
VRPPPEIRLQAFDPGAHAPILRDWLRRPHVARWWGDPRSTSASVLGWPVEDCALIRADETPVGFLCWRTPPEEELLAAGLADLAPGLVDIDLLIGEPELLGRGLGPRALELLLARLRSDPRVTVAGLGTAVENARAVRAFGKAGFRTLREFEDPELGRCVYMVAEVGRSA